MCHSNQINEAQNSPPPGINCVPELLCVDWGLPPEQHIKICERGKIVRIMGVQI